MEMGAAEWLRLVRIQRRPPEGLGNPPISLSYWRSGTDRQDGVLAQMEARVIWDHEAAGSIPAYPTRCQSRDWRSGWAKVPRGATHGLRLSVYHLSFSRRGQTRGTRKDGRRVAAGTCGTSISRCGSMAEHQPSKLGTRVRFPSPAPGAHTLLYMGFLFCTSENQRWLRERPPAGF